jgi:hypothetical protein
MYLNPRLRRLGRNISIAALSMSAAFVTQPAQQASAQGVPGQFGFPPSNPNDINTVVIDGVGASSITNPTLLQLLFDADANGSFESPRFSYDANGNGIRGVNEEFPFWDGLGPAPIVDFNGDGFLDPVNEAARFASFTASGNGNSHQAIVGAGRASLNDNFLFDFYASAAVVVTSAEANNDGVDDATDFPIYNVNPFDTQGVLPVNAQFPNGDFFAPRFQPPSGTDNDGNGVDDGLEGPTGICTFLAGGIPNYNLLPGVRGTTPNNGVAVANGPNVPVTFVFRSDNSGATSTFGNFFEPLCGFDGSIFPEFEKGNNVNPTFLAAIGVPSVGVPLTQGVYDTTFATLGAFTYVDAAFASNGTPTTPGVGPAIPTSPFYAAINGLTDNRGFTPGLTIAVGPVYFGFYPASVYATAAEAGTAANLCFFITSGLDFNPLIGQPADGDALDPFEAGRQAAIDNGFAPPTQPGLDPNCGPIFPGFGGGQLVQQVFSPDGSGAVVPGPVLLGVGDAPILPITTETEDLNGNGVLDLGEDFLNPNGVIDSSDENGDGVISGPGVITEFVPGSGTFLDRSISVGFPLPQ